MKVTQLNFKHLTKKTLFEYQKLFPLLKKEKNKQYGIIALTFFTMTFFGIFAVNPTLTTIFELQRTLEDVRFVDERLTQKISNLQLLNERYNTLGQELILVDRAIPVTPEPILLIGQIRTIATDSNLPITDLTIQTIALTGETVTSNQNQNTSPEGISLPDPENAEQYHFNLSVQGTYTQIYDFLQTLTSFDRVITVNEITLSRESTESQTVRLTVQGTAFYKKR